MHLPSNVACPVVKNVQLGLAARSVAGRLADGRDGEDVVCHGASEGRRSREVLGRSSEEGSLSKRFQRAVQAAGDGESE
jgi:hypothetical protein